jgi:hypothetical protein
MRVSASVEPVVYGADDRYEYGAITSTQVKITADATAAVQDDDQVVCASGTCNIPGGANLVSPGNVVSGSPSAPYCQDVAFVGQFAGYYIAGTAFLVGPDLLMTAAHVLTSQDDCDKRNVIFGFVAGADGRNVVTTVPQSNVYHCREIVASGGGPKSPGGDWAVFRVDRTVTGRVPVIIERTSNIAANRSVYATGFPTELPLKVAPGVVTAIWPPGLVNGQNPQFSFSSDVRIGNSGGPVVAQDTGVVYGIVTGDTTDFYLDPQLSCAHETQLPSGSGGANATPAARGAGYVPLHAALVMSVLAS